MPTDITTITLFRCERRACSLTKASCARMWEQAQLRRPESWDGGWHCRGCPVGACNAGKAEGEAQACAAAAALHNVCQRCLRRAPRLITGRFCISCYNRNREAIKGRNAKGGKPRLCGQLHAETLAVSEGSQTRVERFDSVTSRVEAMVIAAKRATNKITFGRSPPVAMVAE